MSTGIRRLRIAVPFFAVLLLPRECFAGEDHLTRTFQAAHVGNEVQVIPVWFAAWGSSPESEILQMCRPNLANEARLAQTKDLNLFSIYGLRAGVAMYDMPVLEFYLDLTRLRKPEGFTISEERVLAAAIQSLQRIAGDLGIEDLPRIRISIRASDATVPERWKNLAGEYDCIRDPRE